MSGWWYVGQRAHGQQGPQKDLKRNTKEGVSSLTKGSIRCYLKKKFKVLERDVSKVRENLGVTKTDKSAHTVKLH